VPKLTREGAVFVLRWEDGENRFRDDSLRAWRAALDEVEGAEGPKALVTPGAGKFYSNGLDLDWAFRERADDFPGYILEVLDVFASVLTLPCVSVAACNGHAFGAGAQLVVAHDFRLMRAERGYFCMPEIDMKAYLHPGMTAIIQARLPHQSAHELIVTGKRYGADDALARRIVDDTATEAMVRARATEMAAEWAPKADPTMSRLKQDMYPRVIEALETVQAIEN
jgi:enoyl-CoA hydratase/carnithine racemase